MDGGNGAGTVEGIALSIANQLTPRCGVPTLADVRHYLSLEFAGAADYAEAFYKAMEKSHWKDKQRKPITNWKAVAKSYASTAWKNQQTA